MRGEYRGGRIFNTESVELPPRARRIRNLNKQRRRRDGTTSACAENTRVERGDGHEPVNYLRVRGEYSRALPKAAVTVELPPRARRILWSHRGGSWLTGTTSACAENTGVSPLSPNRDRNYLRVRGEYQSQLRPWNTWMELPPRARRIREKTRKPVEFVGTTSACAENTRFSSSNISSGWNYLRVRGEYE